MSQQDSDECECVHAQTFVAFLLVANFGVNVAESEILDMSEETIQTFETIDHAFTIFYVLELRPGAKASGSRTDLLTPWHDGQAEITPFRYLPVLLGGKGTSHVRRETVTSHPREKNYVRSPPVPGFPHVVAPLAPQYPLTPSGWHALREGAWHRRRRVVSCRSACGACTKLPQPRVHLCQPTM